MAKKEFEKYSELQIDHRAYNVRCILGKENNNFFIECKGYVNGKYTHQESNKVFGCFAKTLRELPLKVTLGLENKIIDNDDKSSLFLKAVNELTQYREETLLRLNQFLK